VNLLHSLKLWSKVSGSTSNRKKKQL